MGLGLDGAACSESEARRPAWLGFSLRGARVAVCGARGPECGAPPVPQATSGGCKGSRGSTSESCLPQVARLQGALASGCLTGRRASQTWGPPWAWREPR